MKDEEGVFMEPIEVLAIVYAALHQAGVPCELQPDEERIVLYPDTRDERRPWVIDAGSLTELRRDAL